MTRPSPRRRTGFTLVELLVVIVIVGILIALLVPAIAAAVRRVKEARVTAELGNIANAMQAFKDQYGDYPPSRIMLSEAAPFASSGVTANYLAGYPTASNLALSAAGGIWFSPTGDPRNTSGLPDGIYYNSINNNNDISLGVLAQRSVNALRKFWPRANTPGGSGATLYYHDFNGNAAIQAVNGTPTPDQGYIYLEGDECLAFFLGGIPTQNGPGTTMGMSGFGKNSNFPFSCPGTNPNYPFLFSNNRYNPFYEFEGSRLVDRDGDGVPAYLDTLLPATDAKTLAYFSAYGGNGYDPNDVNFLENDDNPASPAFANAFTASYSGANGSALIGSLSPNCYTNTAPVPATGQSATWQNPNTFQIISAGLDALYGVGGQYVGTSAGSDPLPPPPTADVRQREQDNLTNFPTGRLQ